jgi:apolipoprotein N-acyltransferase
LLSKAKVSEFGELRELSVGKENISTVNFRNQFSAASVVCSEILSPGLVRGITRGSDIIIEMASYGIFHGSTPLVKQNLASAKFRAAEDQKPLIAAVNMGLSYAINSDGSVAKIAPNQASQILTGSLALNPQKSWYNKIGDTPVLAGCLALVIVFSFQLTVYSKMKAWLRRFK